jgi:hypothetical protein
MNNVKSFAISQYRLPTPAAQQNAFEAFFNPVAVVTMPLHTPEQIKARNKGYQATAYAKRKAARSVKTPVQAKAAVVRKIKNHFAKVLRDNLNHPFNTPIAGVAESDRTKSIIGRSSRFA